MKLLTTSFRTNQANRFIETAKSEVLYFFAGQTLSYANNNVKKVDNTIDQTFYSPHDEIVFGKYVSDDDYSLMIKKREWVTGAVYTRYDSQVELENEDFYVVTLEGSDYSVFKCLDNNQGAVSTHKPILSETGPNEEYYKTSDGYVWKLMYTFTNSDNTKFSTNDFIPLVSNTDVANSAISGAIDVVVVENGGSGYTNFGSGNISQVNVGGNSKKLYIQGDSLTTLSANSGFYTNSAFYVASGPGSGQLKTITDYGQEGNSKYVIVDSAFGTSVTTSSTFEIAPEIILDGDGSGFKAKAVVDGVNDNIVSVDVIDRGTDYTYGEVSIGANTQAINTSSYTQASLRAIIPPYGGHSSDAQKELFARYVCISETFVYDTVPAANNDYRTIGILQNPIFNEAQLDLTSVSGLTVGDVVTQANTSANGTISSIDSGNTEITLENVYGVFDNTDIEVSNTSYTVSDVIKDNVLFDQRLKLDVTLTSGSDFEQDELIVQESTNAQGYVHEYANGDVFLVQTEGNFQVSVTNEVIGQSSSNKAIINSITQPGMIKHSSNILYIENLEPVTRFDYQYEAVKIIIGF